MFDTVPTISVIGEAHNGASACELAERLQPDVVLLDIGLPDMDGTEVCVKIKAVYPDCKVMAVSMHEEHTFVTKMLENGASGYLLKNAKKDQMIEAIQAVYGGGTYYSREITDILVSGMKASSSPETPKISRRESEVLKLIAYEYTTSEIAEKLFISMNTVESHRSNLLTKLEVKNTAGLVRVALERNLITKE